MLTNAMLPVLKSLKLYGMAHALADLAEQDSPAFQASVTVLDHLLKAELAEREVRSVAYQLKAAKFPAYRDVNGFNFAESMANEALIRQLCQGDFMDTAQNVVLVGGPGTGKTHLATAIGIQAIEQFHRRDRFFSTIELVNALNKEKQQDKKKTGHYQTN